MRHRPALRRRLSPALCRQASQEARLFPHERPASPSGSKTSGLSKHIKKLPARAERSISTACRRQRRSRSRFRTKPASARRTGWCASGPGEERGLANLPISAMRARYLFQRRLSRPWCRGSARAALRRHRGDAASPRGNLPPRRRGHVTPSSCSTAPVWHHHREARRAEQHHPDLPCRPLHRSFNPVENIWQFLARQLALKPTSSKPTTTSSTPPATPHANFVAKTETITSIGMRESAHIRVSTSIHLLV